MTKKGVYIMENSKKENGGLVNILTDRVAKIVKNIQENEKLDLSLATMAEMTDRELLSAVLDMQISTTNQNPKLIKKLKRQRVGHQKFLDFISKNNGWCSQSEYAEILGVSRQTINNRIAQNTLLAITVNGKKVIPLFQINEKTGGEVDGMSKINKILLEKQEMGVSSSCSFWLGKLNNQDFETRKEGLISGNIEYIERIQKAANLAGEMGK